jgi:AcrR family transcriptional regulator
MPSRNPFEARNVVGRRGGRVKPPLSRDAIVGAALEILKRDGLEGMSLRKVAAALDTGPTSLYVYVESLDELRALVLDRALADVDTSSRKRDFRARLRAVLESYVSVLMQGPGLAQLALSTIAAGPNALRLIERLLGILHEAEVDTATAAWAVDLILLYATAIAAEQTQRSDGRDALASLSRVIDAVSAEEFPRIFAAREPLRSGSGSERFGWALEVLLGGILQNRRG